MSEENKLEIHTLIKENDKKDVEIWTSCCWRLNPHGTAYFGQLAISILILCFCFIMLLKANGSCEQSSPYIGVISFILGRVLSTVMTSTENK